MPTLADLWPVILFTFAMCFSPGPNTMLISSLSSVFGVRASLPCAAGITIGITSLVLAVGLGLGAVVASHPNFTVALRVGGLIYVAWLIWKILSASELGAS